jgi:hypothetical protein
MNLGPVYRGAFSGNPDSIGRLDCERQSFSISKHSVGIRKIRRRRIWLSLLIPLRHTGISKDSDLCRDCGKVIERHLEETRPPQTSLAINGPEKCRAGPPVER